MLRCTGRAYTPTPVRARPRRPGSAHLALPGTRPIPIRPTTWTSRGRLHAGHGLQHRLHLDLPEVGGHIPADPDPPDPVERPLDAAGIDRPGPVPGGLRRPVAWAAALPFALIGADRRAADLGDRPRRGRVERWSPSARASSTPSRCCRRSTWSSRTTSRCTSRWSSGRCGWAPAALRGSPRVVRRSPACWPGSRRCRGTTACWSSSRSGWPSRGIAGARGARAGERVPAIPSGAAVGCVVAFVARDGPVVGAPAGRVRLALAIDGVGQGLLHPRHRRVEQHHDPGDARAAARAWASARCSSRRIDGLVAAIDDLHRRWSPAFVLAPFMLIGGWARRRSRRLRSVLPLRRSAVRVLGHRLGGPRAGRDVHPLGDRAGALTPTSWRSRASSSRSAGSPGDGPRGTRTRPRGSSWARPSASRSCAPSAGSLAVHADWAGRQARFETVANALEAAGAKPHRPGDVHRRVGDEVLDRARAASSSSTTRSSTIEAVARAYDIDWLVLDRDEAVASVERRSSTASDPPGSAPRS